MFLPNPKDPDVEDRYGIDVESDWLQGESILSATITADPTSELILTEQIIEANKVSVLLSGGVEGFYPIKFRITTATRQREYCVTIWIKQGC